MKGIISLGTFRNGFLKKDRFLIFLFLVFLFGLFVGSASSGFFLNKKDSVIFKILEENIIKISSQSIAFSFFDCFISWFLFFLSAYFFGTCAFGSVFIPIAIFIQSVGKGLLLGYYFISNSFLSVLKFICLYIPQNCILIFLYILACGISQKMSVQTFEQISSCSKNDYTFKKYNYFYLICVVLILFFSVINSLLLRLI